MTAKSIRKNVGLPLWLAERVQALSVLWNTSESDVMHTLIARGVKSTDTAETLLARLRAEGFEASVGLLADHPLIVEAVITKGATVRATLNDGRRLFYPRDGAPVLETRLEGER